MTVADTFPKLLLQNAAKRGQRPAIREKDLGIWQTWTWSQVADEIRALACGLAAMGFKRGDKIVIAGDNRPAGCLAIDLRNAAIILISAHHLVNALYFAKDLLDQCLSSCGVVVPEPHTHLGT